MRARPNIYRLIATLTLALACASLAQAYEQSSYFIFDIVATQSSSPVNGRLAVPAAAMAAVPTEEQPRSESQAKRSEFEIDFHQSIQPKGNEAANFTFDQAIETPAASDSSFSNGSLDLGTQQSIFGE